MAELFLVGVEVLLLYVTVERGVELLLTEVLLVDTEERAGELLDLELPPPR